LIGWTVTVAGQTVPQDGFIISTDWTPMSSHAHIMPVSPQDYLEGEKTAQVRHEYVAGRVFALAGGSQSHNLINGNLLYALKTHLRGGACKVFVNDLKVEAKANEVYYYPDLMVTCDPSDDGEYVKKRPVLIVEILSPSTETTDRREKWVHYQRLETLREYVLVSQDARRVEVFRRAGDAWDVETFEGDETVNLDSVGVRVGMGEVYEGVMA